MFHVPFPLTKAPVLTVSWENNVIRDWHFVEALDHVPSGSCRRERPVFYILNVTLTSPAMGVPWVCRGTHAECWCLPLCPHQILWGPRKLWGLTHTLTPSAACDLGPDVLGWVGPT